MASESSNQYRVVDDCTIGSGTDIANFATLSDCTVGEDCRIWRFVNLYGCDIGDESMIGSFVEIQRNVSVGTNCRIQSHSFVCSKVTIEDDVFVGHGVTFSNDVEPPSRCEREWKSTTVGRGATIGNNATLLPVDIGENALVGAGAVVIDDVPPNAVVAGNPAEVIDVRDD